MSTLYQKTTKSIKWSVLTVIAPKFISPLVMIALARILAPESFGLLSTAMIVISFAQMFWDAGLSRALIQTQEPIDKIANVVFWSNIILGILIYIIIYISAPLLSGYLKSPQSIPVIRVLSFQIVILSLSTVQESLFTKDLNFKPLFWIRIISSIATGLFSIILALFGFNVWALVLGTLFGSVFNLSLLWIKSNWRPNIQIDWILAPKLFRFGSWIVLLSLMGWIINWFDSILVGRYLGITDLGLYRTGVMMVSMCFSLLIGPISTVLFPAFSRIQNDNTKIIKHFIFVNKLIIFIVIPIGVGLYLVSDDFVPLIFGEKWRGMGIVIGILGLSEGLGWCVGINPTIYQAIGKPDLQPKLSLFLLPLFIVTYVLVIPLGMLPLLWAKLGLTLFTLPINMIPLVRVLKISPFYVLQQGKYIFVSTIVFTVLIIAFKRISIDYLNLSNHFILLSGSIIIGIVSYLGILWFFDRSFLLQIKSIVKIA